MSKVSITSGTLNQSEMNKTGLAVGPKNKHFGYSKE